MSASTATAPVSRAAGPDWPLLVSLQQRCMRATDTAELAFVIANESWHLLPYTQAAVFLGDSLGRPALKAVSGLAQVQEDTPFTIWLARVEHAVRTAQPGAGPQRLSPENLPPELHAGWQEWWPAHALWIPLQAQQPEGGKHLGSIILVRDEAWSDGELQLLGLLAETWGYCLHSLLGRARGAGRLLRNLGGRPVVLVLGLALVAALSLVPVRLSVLAPAEIIPLRAQAIAAPTEGIVKTFHVAPNTPVKQGQLLFSLDDTTLRNRREIARKALAVARTEAQATQQKSFDNLQSRGELSAQLGRVREKEAELAYLDEAINRIEVRAPLDGILVYGDPNDWLGKPVVTGERVAQLAQPDDLGVLVWLPVADAINLEPGAPLRVYLQVAPLAPLEAELVQTSYQATLSPDGIAAYRIRGRLGKEDGAGVARLGLRGTAKLYGGQHSLGYWMLRRPLGALRQWAGL